MVGRDAGYPEQLMAPRRAAEDRDEGFDTCALTSSGTVRGDVPMSLARLMTPVHSAMSTNQS